jgi:hypothetical protein
MMIYLGCVETLGNLLARSFEQEERFFGNAILNLAAQPVKDKEGISNPWRSGSVVL